MISISSSHQSWHAAVDAVFVCTDIRFGDVTTSMDSFCRRVLEPWSAQLGRWFS
jgi:hypothetical protein